MAARSGGEENVNVAPDVGKQANGGTARPHRRRLPNLSPRDVSRLCWLILAGAMALSAAWILYSGRGMTFTTDEVYYYARFVAHGVVATPTGGIEYFFAPHNGHLVIVGKVIYRVLLLIFGSHYIAFRIVEVASVFLCVGLFFVIARRRVGAVAALIPSVLMLFFGYAYETLLWPFNMHTTLALALGLAALLALEREDRKGDVAACAFLVLATGTVELGLAFAVGVAVSVLVRPDRIARLWIFLIPFVFYAAWWLWAKHFDQSEVSLLNVHLIPIDFANGLAAVTGSIFGVNPTGVGIEPQLVGTTAWGTAIGAALIAALVYRFRRGAVPTTFWVAVAVLLTYWVTIALGGRPPDSSRYVLVGALLLFLIVAEALAGLRLPAAGLLAFTVLLGLAIPPNVAKFYDGRRLFLNEAEATQTEYAMLDLIRDKVNPAYAPAADPRVDEQGGGLGAPLAAGEYFRASGEFGSLAYPLSRIRSESLQMQNVADATLIDGLGVVLEPIPEPAGAASCPTSTEGSAEAPIFFELEPRGVVLGGTGTAPVEVTLSRFGKAGPGIPLGQVAPGEWSKLVVPGDAAPDGWRVTVNGPFAYCRP
jgi:hypothetical protein